MIVELDNKINTKRTSELKRFYRTFFGRKVVIFGMVVITILVIIAIFAPIIAPYDPNKTDFGSVLTRPSLTHWLGTDSVGRDVLSRIIYGSRVSLLVSIMALLVASVVGMSLGLIAGYYGGFIYMVIMRIMDAMMTIPMILLALTIAAITQGGFVNVIIALGVSLVPTYARIMCGQALSVKQSDYILAARTIGVNNKYIMLRHVLPNCWPPLIVLMTMQLGTTVLAEASLSFLGIGVRPPQATWGNLINDGYKFLASYPILAFSPGIAIMLVVFSFNMVGDGLRDALDPKLRGLL
jgi:peptide/nickel transport system permease protein